MFNKVCAIAVYLTILGAGAVMFSLVHSSTTKAQGGPPSWSGHDYWMPGWMHRHMWGRRGRSLETRARRQRHWTFMHDGLPEAYEQARSTIKIDKAAIDEGHQLYAQNCASCHGRTGDRDGEAAKSLTPSPALLSFMIQQRTDTACQNGRAGKCTNRQLEGAVARNLRLPAPVLAIVAGLE